MLGVGAKPGVVFEPSPWEDVFVANSYADMGNLEGARELIADVLARRPDDWKGYFNAACLEARLGDRELALEYLGRAVDLGPEQAREYAQTDSDFDSIRGEPRFVALLRAS